MPFAGAGRGIAFRDLTFVSHQNGDKPTDGNFKHQARISFACFAFALFWTAVTRHQIRRGFFRRSLNTKREKNETL